MKKTVCTKVFLVTGLLLVSLCLHAQPRQKDVGRDHPLLERFPGSVIVRHKSDEFDTLAVPLGKATDVDEFEESTRVEGKITRITYEMTEVHSTTEVFRSYRDALAGAGFEILYLCEMEVCGNQLYFQNLERPFIIRGEHRYLAARVSPPQGNAYVTVRVYTTAKHDPPVRAMVNVAEVGGMESDLVKVNAEAISSEIISQGHIALYGIYFETDKAELQSASDVMLQEMARFLATDPLIKVYIVGHTDTVGALDYNMELSQRRAEAVVQALVARYRADATRLISMGVGPLSPVATNRTEVGRARNRRVELVQQ